MSLTDNVSSEISIYNELGKEVYHSTLINNQSSIDLSSQPKGIYFVKVIASGKGQGAGDEERVFTEKVILH